MRARAARRILAAIGTLAVAGSVAVSAAPAWADGGWIQAEMSDVTIAASGGVGKVYAVEVLSDVGVTNPTVTFDFSGLGDVATPSFPDATDNCEVSASAATCHLAPPTADQQLELTIPLKLVPGSGAHDGATGTISITASVDGGTPDTSTAQVSVVDGPDLVLPASSADSNVAPGDKVNLKTAISNAGSKPAQAVLLMFALSHGITPDAYDNCLYANWPDDNGTYVLCEIDGPLNPGDSWTIDPGLTGKIANDSATFARADLIVDSDNSANVDAAAKSSVFAPKGARLNFTRRASGKTLKASQASTGDVDYGDNFLTYAYQVKTAYDMVGVGATVHGSVGDVASVKLGVKDDGPASLDSWSSHEWVVGFVVTVPEWAEVVGVPKDCNAADSPTGGEHGQKPGYPYYICWDANTYFLEAGTSYTETFKFKIKSTSGKDGASALNMEDGGRSDTNHANDTAAITLSTGGDSSLPVTGAKAGLIGGVGGALLLVGALLVIVARRRKATTV